MGFGVSEIPGSKVHDEIEYSDDFHRLTNNAGGIEGGMSNGEPIIVKPGNETRYLLCITA